MNRFLRQAMGLVFMAPEGDGAAGATGTTGATGVAAALAAGQPAPGTAPAAGAPAAGQPAAIPADAWYKDFKDDGVKQWLLSYKDAYPNAEALAQKALHLEKFVGAEKAGRGVIAPKADASADEWKAFLGKVGLVPEKPDAYTLPKDFDPKVAEAISKDPLMGKFREYAHKIGLPTAMFGNILSWFATESKNKFAADDAAFEAKATAELETLKGEWKGADYDKNVELGRRAANAFVPHKTQDELAETLTRMEGAIGPALTLKIWAAVGKGMAEDGYISGDMGSAGASGAPTPEAARAQIAELKKDQAWVDSFMKGDTEKRALWDKLHRIGYPDPQKQT